MKQTKNNNNIEIKKKILHLKFRTCLVVKRKVRALS